MSLGPGPIRMRTGGFKRRSDGAGCVHAIHPAGEFAAMVASHGGTRAVQPSGGVSRTSALIFLNVGRAGKPGTIRTAPTRSWSAWRRPIPSASDPFRSRSDSASRRRRPARKRDSRRPAGPAPSAARRRGLRCPRPCTLLAPELDQLAGKGLAAAAAEGGFAGNRAQARGQFAARSVPAPGDIARWPGP